MAFRSGAHGANLPKPQDKANAKVSANQAKQGISSSANSPKPPKKSKRKPKGPGKKSDIHSQQLSMQYDGPGSPKPAEGATRQSAAEPSEDLLDLSVEALTARLAKNAGKVAGKDNPGYQRDEKAEQIVKEQKASGPKGRGRQLDRGQRQSGGGGAYQM